MPTPKRKPSPTPRHTVAGLKRRLRNMTGAHAHERARADFHEMLLEHAAKANAKMDAAGVPAVVLEDRVQWLIDQHEGLLEHNAALQRRLTPVPIAPVGLLETALRWVGLA